MHLLLCSEFYTPSVGGVQEVVRMLAEAMVRRGHRVTVATTRLRERNFSTLNGVEIAEFAVTGNYVRGIIGDVESYQRFVVDGEFDVAMIYAAQQWTFDALWPVLESIPFGKVLVPCGFSALYEPAYTDYFERIPAVLASFDQLIFNATKYRDIDFVRKLGITDLAVIANGADEAYFRAPADPGFRQRYGIADEAFVFLTVGSRTGLKGHRELEAAFSRMKLPSGLHATLILNGNEVTLPRLSVQQTLKAAWRLWKSDGAKGVFAALQRRLSRRLDAFKPFARTPSKSAQVHAAKRVLKTDLPRGELVQAFMAADLFVFASNIEYSPLVLFESAAAGTPFLTVDVGNAEEIARWTEAGIMCPSTVDEKGYTRVDEGVLATTMEECMRNRAKLHELGEAGRTNWMNQFTWNKVADRYEEIFLKFCRAQR